MHLLDMLSLPYAGLHNTHEHFVCFSPYFLCPITFSFVLTLRALFPYQSNTDTHPI